MFHELLITFPFRPCNWRWPPAHRCDHGSARVVAGRIRRNVDRQRGLRESLSSECSCQLVIGPMLVYVLPSKLGGCLRLVALTGAISFSRHSQVFFLGAALLRDSDAYVRSSVIEELSEDYDGQPRQRA